MIIVVLVWDGGFGNNCFKVSYVCCSSGSCEGIEVRLVSYSNGVVVLLSFDSDIVIMIGEGLVFVS